MPGRVLVITYFFPPVGGVGVQRTLKYIKYLPRWGWQPIVLAPRDPAYPLRDPSLLGSLSRDLEVHRTLSLEPTRLTQAARRLLGRSTFGDGSDIHDSSAPGPARHGRGRFQRMLRTSASIWSSAWGAVLFPDEAVAWLPSATSRAVRLARGRSVDVLYSSSPPVATHLIAGLTKVATGRPWVADFRDPWVGSSFAPRASLLRRRLQERTERWIVDHADAIVVAVESLRDELVARYPDTADRVVYIPNGYDRGELADLPPGPSQDPTRFRLVYGGSLYRERELEVFLAGVDSLLARRPELRQRLSVQFVGRVNEANAAVAAAYSARLGDVMSFMGFLPRREALAWMATADALLQLMPADPNAGVFVGGKLLEYLAFDRPILAMMPPGEGRRLVDGLESGLTADVDPFSVAAALERLLDDPPRSVAADPTGRYDRVNLAMELSRVLDRVVASGREATGGSARRTAAGPEGG